MRNKSIIFLFALIFMIVFSVSAVSADDLQGTDSGEVSGDVDVVSENPWSTSGQLTYDIPSEARNIESANLYVNVYAGSAKNTHGAIANVSLNTSHGENQIASEQLWIEDGSTDGTIYKVNNHTTKCYSDYQMYYDITDSLKGLNGTSISINVDTFKMEGMSFDGRIKLIALILAYDDGDNDKISFWIDSTQKWTKTNVTTTFSTKDVKNIVGADLYNIALSSADGSYRLNDELIGDAANHTSGNYYQYNYWDVTDKMKEGQDTNLLGINAGTSSYASFKSVLSVLKVESVDASVSLATEYTSVNTCYAGTNNALTINVNSNKAGKYVVELLADGAVVNSSEVDLDGASQSSLILIDPTIRPVDETTVNGANNTKVNYVVNVKLADNVVSSANKTVPVLYNGNLGKDLAYNATYIEDFTSIAVSGGVEAKTQDASTYMSAGTTNRTDVWSVDLDDSSSLVKTFVYVAYNWDKSGAAGPVFNVTFNGNAITPKAHYRDQSNLGNYGKYGYGLFVYDVSDLAKSGNNTLVLNKEKGLTAVYPSTLIYLYNTTGSKILTTVYLADGADLMSNANNNAGRIAKTDSTLNINSKDLIGADFYIFAASAQAGEGNIAFNGDEAINVWNGTSNSVEVYAKNITSSVADSNSVSFVATGSTILALNQMIVTTEKALEADVSLATEYTSVNTCYAGTNNALTINVNSNKAGKYVVELLADGAVVNSSEVDLDGASQSSLILIDPTIRPVDETTVNGANNNKVNYAVNVKLNDKIVADANKTVPVLYNGNLGKDLAYNATYIEDCTVIAVSGGVEAKTQDVSTYMSAGTTNRTDVWSVDLDDSSSLVKTFVYVAYNWDKSGITGPVFNVTFNGNAITPKAHYRDQSNLGNYGKYGYGLFVYDVSDFAQAGNNTLVLNKEKGLTAVYPSTLIYLYNTTGSKVLTTVYLADGADLMSNANNNAGRIAKTDSTLNVSSKDLISADFNIFAASAQAGEGNIAFNGDEATNVWNGTSNSVEVYAKNITSSVADSNSVSFVATGSTILALNQMIVTTQKVSPIETSVTAKVLSTTYDSGKTFDVKVLDADNNPVSGLKLTLKIYTNSKYFTKTVKTDENGVASYKASTLAIGTHKVEITSSNSTYNVKKTTSYIKIAKAKTTVSAPKVTFKAKKSNFFKVTVKNKATGKAVKSVNVKIKVFTGKKSSTYTIKTNSKGVAQFNTKSLKVGSHKVVISSGDSKYIIAGQSTIVIKK